MRWLVSVTRSQSDRHFMAIALRLAEQAAEVGETPVGAVIVENGCIVGRGFNQIECSYDPTAHAELIAMREAARSRGDWRLHGATLYATVEPCIMCAAAAIHARVSRVVFGAYDPRWGGFGSLFDLAHDPRLNHDIEVVSGVMGEESARLCTAFFSGIRSRKKKMPGSALDSLWADK